MSSSNLQSGGRLLTHIAKHTFPNKKVFTSVQSHRLGVARTGACTCKARDKHWAPPPYYEHVARAAASAPGSNAQNGPGFFGTVTNVGYRDRTCRQIEVPQQHDRVAGLHACQRHRYCSTCMCCSINYCTLHWKRTLRSRSASLKCLDVWL